MINKSTLYFYNLHTKKIHHPMNDYKNIKIGLFTVHRLNNRVGGTEKVLCNMANAFSDFGYSVSIIYCDETPGIPFFRLNSDIITINTFTKIPFFSRQLFRNLRSFSLDKQKKYRKRKIIECNWKGQSIKSAISHHLSDFSIFVCFDFESVYILKAILSTDHPIIVTLQTAPELAFSDHKNDLFFSHIDSCSALHILMPEFKDPCRKLFPKVPIIHIPNSTPKIEISPQYSNKKIICVSRFDPEKRPELLVHAFSLLSPHYPDWSVEFWGRPNGRNTRNLEALIKKEKLDNKFKLCGTTNNIADKLSKASIFVIPSKFEGFCLSLIEAMATGLPSVGMKDCPAVNSLIQNNISGILASPTPESLASSIEQLITNEELRQNMGQKAKTLATSFSEESVWNQWKDLILKLIVK